MIQEDAKVYLTDFRSLKSQTECGKKTITPWVISFLSFKTGKTTALCGGSVFTPFCFTVPVNRENGSFRF